MLAASYLVCHSAYVALTGLAVVLCLPYVKLSIDNVGDLVYSWRYGKWDSLGWLGTGDEENVGGVSDGLHIGWSPEFCARPARRIATKLRALSYFLRTVIMKSRPASSFVCPRNL